MPTQRSNAGTVVFVLVVAAAMIAAIRNSKVSRLPDTEPPLISFADDDEEMNDAMAKARETVDEFIVALGDPQPSQTDFSIKVGFRDAHGNEYICLNNVTYHDGVFHGTIGNEPETVRSVRYGEPVTVAKDQIGDWMYIDDGKLIGGYTMRVMRSRLAPDKRAEFDANITFTLD
jgi:uncharacterized protein YegJ (DUF2314 family)